eukprot:152754-Chlamydomonas_euryale.AAC.4
MVVSLPPLLAVGLFNPLELNMLTTWHTQCMLACVHALFLHHGMHGCSYQLRPNTSSRLYSVSSRNASDANTIGQSGRVGSQITKFC